MKRADIIAERPHTSKTVNKIGSEPGQLGQLYPIKNQASKSALI